MRGVTANIIILEEIAFMKVQCWQEVIIPLLSLKETATIGITTVSPAPDNFVTDLIKRKVIPNVAIELVCGECKKQGTVDTCRHMEYLRPETQDDERSQLVRNCYPPDNGDIFAREMQGVIVQDPTNCFNHDRILEVYSGRRFDPRSKHHPYLFITIDPCSASMKAGNMVSDFAIMSHLMPSLSILGFEAIEILEPLSWESRLIEHINRCYEIPSIKNAKLIVFVEGNMATEATNIKNCIRKHFPTSSFPGTLGAHKTGVLSTNQTKHDMQFQFSVALLNEQVSISSTFITTDPKPQTLLDKWRNQCMEYSKIAKEGKTPLEGTRYMYSGKGTSTKKKDDLAIVTQLGHYCVQRFLTTKEWAVFH